MSVVWMELAGLLNPKRWTAAALVLVVAGMVVAHDLSEERRRSGLNVNQWDVPLETLNNVVIVCWLLVPAFVGLVGDVVLRDRWTGHAQLRLPRIGSRTRWWMGKMGAVLAAAALYFVGLVLVLSIIGLLFTDWGWGLSEYGSAYPQQPMTSGIVLAKSYSPPPFPELPVFGVLVVALYEAVATWALVVLVLAVSQWFPRPWIPLALSLSLVAVFFRITPTTIAHPLLHLFWDIHNLGSRVYAVEWWASAVIVGLEAILALNIGVVILHRSDI